ncbi:MAG: ABC transporter permease [Stappiaceae bacterium]
MTRHGIVHALFVGIVVLAFWQALVVVLDLPRFMLPAPYQVFLALERRFGFFMHHASITGLETVLGLIFGTLSGIFVALTMSLFPIARRLVMPLIVISQALPVFAIAPLLVLWFGFGIASKVVMAMLIIFFPVASYFYDGLRRTDPELVDLGRLRRANQLQMLLHIRVPAALPALSSGLRVSAVFAPIGAIVGEWVGSSAGLGFIMLQANARMQTDSMFAALFLLALMALALRYSVAWLTRQMVPWQTET